LGDAFLFFVIPVAERWLLSVAEAPNIFTEKSRISAALNDRDFFCVVEAEQAPTWVKMLKLCGLDGACTVSTILCLL